MPMMEETERGHFRQRPWPAAERGTLRIARRDAGPGAVRRGWRSEAGMNGRSILPAVVIAILFTALPARAQQVQDPSTPGTNPLNNNYGSPFPLPLGRGLEDPPKPAPTGPQVTSLSSYILGGASHPDGCCGPTGGPNSGPISWDIYFRNGVALSFGNPFAGDLNAGWAVQGGARALLFDRDEEAAWVIDFGITNIYQQAGGENVFHLTNLTEKNAAGQQITIPDSFLTSNYLNRTMVGVSLGRELWVMGSGKHAVDGAPGLNWRLGWDFGGRWGTEKWQPNEFHHLTDVNGGIFLALHTDLECNCGSCIFQTGFRLEYAYTWDDVIQHQNRGDIQDILLMWTLGIRF
jgi:hypothetical protein